MKSPWSTYWYPLPPTHPHTYLWWWWCGGGGFFLAYENWGRMFDHSFPACTFFFKVEISPCTLMPLSRPGSVHSGSAIWDVCDWVFPDELHVSSFPDRFPHYATPIFLINILVTPLPLPTHIYLHCHTNLPDQHAGTRKISLSHTHTDLPDEHWNPNCYTPTVSHLPWWSTSMTPLPANRMQDSKPCSFSALLSAQLFKVEIACSSCENSTTCWV